MIKDLYNALNRNKVGKNMSIEKSKIKIDKDKVEPVMLRLANTNLPLYYLVKGLSIYIDPKRDNLDGEAAVQVDNAVVLFNDFAAMDLLKREAYLMHLTLHWAKKHSPRNTNMERMYKIYDDKDKGKIRSILNFVEDCIVNYMLAKEYINTERKWEMLEKYGVKADVERESMEEILEKFMDGLPKINITGFAAGNCLSRQKAEEEGYGELLDYGNGKIEGERLQEGGVNKMLENGEAADADRAVDEWMKRSILRMKTAGVNHGALFDALLGELLPPEVPWYKLVLNNLQSYLKSFSDSSFSRASRRGEEYMGEIIYSKPKLWVLVDTSGSVSDDEMLRFYSESEAILPYAREIEFVLWDAGILKDGRYRYKRGQHMEIVRSSGGTTFAPVLRDLKKEIKREDIVVTMTDGYLADKEEAKGYLDRMMCKKILVTTHEPLEGFNRTYTVGYNNK